MRAWTAKGCFSLPAEAAEVLAADHPFLQQAASDLIAICHHPEAGRFVLGGWAEGSRAVSFSHESGAHAGPTADETRAFLLLPGGAALAENARGWVRPFDLRRAAMEVLGKKIQRG